eukprot:1578724-Rhodomonas_salina.1
MAPITICIGYAITLRLHYPVSDYGPRVSTGLVGGVIARKIKGPTVARTFSDSMSLSLRP